MRSFGTPRASRARAVNVIMISGPHDEGDGVVGIERRPRDQLGDDADAAVPVLAGVVDRDGELDVEASAPVLELARGRGGRPACGRRRGRRRRRTRRGGRGRGRRPGAAARGRFRRRRSRGRDRGPPRAATSFRTGRARRSRRPAPCATSAWETAPTSRIVCTSAPPASGAALVEIGTSPTPKA